MESKGNKMKSKNVFQSFKYAFSGLKYGFINYNITISKQFLIKLLLIQYIPNIKIIFFYKLFILLNTHPLSNCDLSKSSKKGCSKALFAEILLAGSNCIIFPNKSNPTSSINSL